MLAAGLYAQAFWQGAIESSLSIEPRAGGKENRQIWKLIVVCPAIQGLTWQVSKTALADSGAYWRRSARVGAYWLWKALAGVPQCFNQGK